MTRKRFIKLCMSYDMQRNQAQQEADLALAQYGNYQKAWDAKMPFIATRRIAMSFRTFAKRCKAAVKAFSDSFDAIAYSLKNITYK